MSGYQPNLGDIGLTQITGDVGALIRLGQWLNGDGFANYEHAFVFIGDGQIVEAEPGGARIADLTEYDARTIAWVPCPPEHGAAVAQAARELVGTPYSAADYFALALHRFHIPVPWLKAYVNSSKHEICSQLDVTAAVRGGWQVVPASDWPGYVTPADLAKLATAVP